MPLAKAAKYNSQNDMVAGRTASQIESAKRKAVGGKKKRCTKGKSCSATCIAINKVCMVEIPWVAAQALPKVVALVNKITSKRSPEGIPKTAPSKEKEQAFAKQEYDIKASTMLDNMRGAIKNDDKPTYDFFKKKITELHAKATAEGVDVGALRVPKWRAKPQEGSTQGETPAKKLDKLGRAYTYEPIKEQPGFVNASGPKATLPPLKNEADFKEIMKQTSYMNPQSHQKLLDMHERLSGILVIKGRPTEIQKELIRHMGGEDKLREAVSNIKYFTGDGYKTFRLAQRNNSDGIGDKDNPYLNRANEIEKLIAVLPKESVVKFRGVKASDATLDAVLAAAKDKAVHSEGALASWSTSLFRAKNFAEMAGGDTPNSIIYRTVNVKGASVRAVSEYKREDEILTPGSARYRHTGRVEEIEVDGRIVHVIDLEELE